MGGLSDHEKRSLREQQGLSHGTWSWSLHTMRRRRGGKIPIGVWVAVVGIMVFCGVLAGLVFFPR